MLQLKIKPKKSHEFLQGRLGGGIYMQVSDNWGRTASCGNKQFVLLIQNLENQLAMLEIAKEETSWSRLPFWKVEIVICEWIAQRKIVVPAFETLRQCATVLYSRVRPSYIDTTVDRRCPQCKTIYIWILDEAVLAVIVGHFVPAIVWKWWKVERTSF